MRVATFYDLTGILPYAFAYSYDLAGNLLTTSYPSGRTVTTQYDAAGRAISVAGPASTYASNVQYTPDGRLATANFHTGTGQITESWTFDRLQRQPLGITVSRNSGAVTLLVLKYGYCPGQAPGTQVACTTNNGNVLSAAVTVPGALSTSQSFTYDGLNRIQSAGETNGGLGWSEQYGFDAVGNRQSIVTPFPSPWQPAGYSAATNHALGAGWTYDGGNLTATPQFSMAYDAENRLKWSQAGGVARQYVYDGEGRRVKAGETVYVYDAFGQLAAEYGSGDVGSPLVYLTADALGSTRLLTSPSTVANNGVVQRTDYMPFGDEIPATGCGSPAGPGRSPRCDVFGYGAGVQQSIKFTGKERDTETGLDYFGARYLSAAQGRFTSVDPAFESEILEYPQTWNRYSYVYNNPLRFRDPDGRCPNCFAAGVGALIGGAIEGGIDLYSQLHQNGADWSHISQGELWGSVAGGAVAGGLAGFTMGGSLVADIAVGGTANVAGGVVNRTIQSAAGDGAVDPLGGNEVATDLMAGAAGGAIGHGVATRVADVIHSPIVGPKPRPGRNVRARQAAYNARKQAVQNAAGRGFAVGAAASTPAAHWIGSAISNGFWNSLDWLISSQPPVKACVTISDSWTGTTSTQCQ